MNIRNSQIVTEGVYLPPSLNFPLYISSLLPIYKILIRYLFLDDEFARKEYVVDF